MDRHDEGVTNRRLVTETGLTIVQARDEPGDAGVPVAFRPVIARELDQGPRSGQQASPPLGKRVLPRAPAVDV